MGGGYKMGGGGHVKFYPYERGRGTEKVLAILKGGIRLLYHVSKLREAPKFALYQFGTERRTLRATA